MSSVLSARRQLLPNEMLTNVLLEMDPWDVWPLRRVCRNFNTYIMRYLAPRRYLPMTTIFVRGEDSWIFVGANNDIVTPSTPGESADAHEAEREVPAVLASPFSSNADHRGQKLAFLATRVPHHVVSRTGPSAVAQPIAEFLPALEAERDIIQMKLDDRVQVIIRVGVKYFRHVQIPSLVVDRETLVMSLDWRELFNAVLNMPEDVRHLKDARAWPSKLWIPDAYYWVDRPDSDEDSDMYISEPSGAESGIEGEGDVQSAHASEGSLAGEVEIPIAPVPAPVVVVAVPLVEGWDEPEALTELTEVLPSPEEPHADGFGRDEVTEHVLLPSPPASEGGASGFGPAAYGEGLTTTEEALREAFAPSYALLLDYDESSSEGGRPDEHAEPIGELRSIAVTSEEYLPHSLRQGISSDAAIPSVPPVTPSAQSRDPAVEAAISELTPPSGSGARPSSRDLSPTPPPVAGDSFLVLEDTSAENTSSDSAGAAATTGHGSATYRSVGVQVHPVMLNAGPTMITRHHSWP